MPLSRVADSDRLQCAPTVVVELHLIRQGLADILGQQPGKALVDLFLGRLVPTILAQGAHQTQPLFYALWRQAPVNRRAIPENGLPPLEFNRLGTRKWSGCILGRGSRVGFGALRPLAPRHYP